MENRALILNHGLGTGKTLTSIFMFEALKKRYPNLRAEVVVPAKLLANFTEAIGNAGVKAANYNVSSYDKFIKRDQDNSDTVLILDEAHVLRTSGTEKSTSIQKVADKCFRVIVLTGTPMVNYPSDIAALHNICDPTEKMDTSWGTWRKKYVKTVKENGFFPFTKATKEVKLMKTEELERYFRGLISCVYSDLDNFPKAYYYSKKIEMGPEQYQVYQSLEKEILDSSARRILGESADASKTLNTFLNKTRSVSNTLENLSSGGGDFLIGPKFWAIEEHLEKENRFPVVIYSFFLDAGVLPLKKLLEKKYKCKLISGDTKTADVSEIVKGYNDGQYDILFLTSAAGYGLDLKRTKQVHITEPAFNKANIDQVIGRAVRYKSHDSLASAERFVNVYYWLSVIPRGFFGYFKKPRPSADEYLFEMSAKKNAMSVLFINFLCQVSIESKKE